eukprot:UN08960
MIAGMLTAKMQYVLRFQLMLVLILYYRMDHGLTQINLHLPVIMNDPRIYRLQSLMFRLGFPLKSIFPNLMVITNTMHCSILLNKINKTIQNNNNSSSLY